MQEDNDNTPMGDQVEPYHIRLPGFITDEETGLGDAVKRMTYAMNIQPCGGCERRAAALNSWVVFTR